MSVQRFRTILPKSWTHQPKYKQTPKTHFEFCSAKKPHWMNAFMYIFCLISPGNQKQKIMFTFSGLQRSRVLKDVLLSSTFYTADPFASGKNNLFNITSSSFRLPTISLNKCVQTTQFRNPNNLVESSTERGQYSEDINSAMFCFLALCLQKRICLRPKRATQSLAIIFAFFYSLTQTLETC